MYGGAGNNREVCFRRGEELGIRLLNSEIKLHQDFDLSKDTKFSMRTLLLLCVFCIGVFGFGLNPNFFGYDLTTNFRAFILFCEVVLCGQAVITRIQYNLNKDKLRRHLARQKEEYDKLKTSRNIVQKELRQLCSEKEKLLNNSFPQHVLNQQVNSIEELDRLLEPMCENTQNRLEYLNGAFDETRKNYVNSKIFYNWVNGYIVSILTFVALVFGGGSFYYNKSVADAFFGDDNNQQFLLLNIKNFNTSCLLQDTDQSNTVNISINAFDDDV